MQADSIAKTTEKKSKFIAQLYELTAETTVQEIIKEQKQKHKKAAHICYAYIKDNEEVIKNDGEVGYPAKAILEVLKANNLHNHLLLVIRYFGGIKLGPGGVKRAFKEAAKECINI